MDTGVLLAYAGVFAVFLVTALIVYFLAKNRQAFGLAVCATLWAGFTALMYFGMETASGWDGLWYFIALLGFSAPSGVGLVLGGIVGWLKSEKETHA